MQKNSRSGVQDPEVHYILRRLKGLQRQKSDNTTRHPQSSINHVTGQFQFSKLFIPKKTLTHNRRRITERARRSLIIQRDRYVDSRIANAGRSRTAGFDIDDIGNRLGFARPSIRTHDRAKQFERWFRWFLAHYPGPFLSLAKLYNFGLVQFTSSSVGRLPSHDFLPGTCLDAFLANAVPKSAIPFVSLQRYLEAVIFTSGAIGRGARIEGTGCAATSVISRTIRTGCS